MDPEESKFGMTKNLAASKVIYLKRKRGVKSFGLHMCSLIPNTVTVSIAQLMTAQLFELTVEIRMNLELVLTLSIIGWCWG